MPADPAFDLPRALRQSLTSLRSAGLTHLPRAAQAETAAESAAETASRQPLERHPGRASSARPAAPASSPAAASPVESASPSAPARTNAPAPLFAEERTPAVCSMTLDERRRELAAVAQRVAACVRCRELAETRRQTVFGVGNPEAELMFIGEAPGADEDRLGEPFVGKAGQLLDKIIEAARLTREELYICNILRCRPPGNRNPTPAEARNCREYLDEQIRIVDPDYIVCWGTVAAQNLLDTTDTIGRLRRRFHTHGRAKVLCTYHPSYLLRTPSAKKDVWEDVKFLRRTMGVDLDAK